MLVGQTVKPTSIHIWKDVPIPSLGERIPLYNGKPVSGTYLGIINDTEIQFDAKFEYMMRHSGKAPYAADIKEMECTAKFTMHQWSHEGLAWALYADDSTGFLRGGQKRAIVYSSLLFLVQFSETVYGYFFLYKTVVTKLSSLKLSKKEYLGIPIEVTAFEEATYDYELFQAWAPEGYRILEVFMK